ncbi:hypothetical protein [Helicobacter cetorum]|uniref:hypothetical protein n=1 Tax=Helicobacter cetorum TaxID=138563 RepID=UPI0002DBBDBD|nr:hypothetical protein [Helicobacter cetorum]
MQKLKDFINKHESLCYVLGLLILMVPLIINHIDREMRILANALTMLIFALLYAKNIR